MSTTFAPATARHGFGAELKAEQQEKY